MKFDLKYIQVGELENYVSSEEYNKHSFVPISKSRAISHANNPRARKSDIALILAYDKTRLIGYLGIIPEFVFKGNESIKVCWLSCMWVLPEYRRSGIARHLLSDAYRLYHGLVFITNYIPRSKAAFFKTGYYIEIAKLNGMRAYLHLDLATILPRKYRKLTWLKPLFWIIDTFLNALISINDRKKLSRIELNNSYEYLDRIDEETGKFIEAAMITNPFRRAKQEFEWMRKYPWVSDKKDKSVDYGKYYFSQYSPEFKQWFIRIRNTDNRMVGFMVLTRHKHELKTPYLLSTKENYKDIFLFVCQLLIKEKIPTLVTYHNELAAEVRQNKKYFLTIRQSEYGFIATKEIKEMMHNDYGMLDNGDGDGVFT